MKKLFNKETGELAFFQIDIEVKNIGRHKFWGKTKDFKDSFLMPKENIFIFIESTKISKGLGDEQNEEPKITIGKKYRVTIEEI